MFVANVVLEAQMLAAVTALRSLILLKLFNNYLLKFVRIAFKFQLGFIYYLYYLKKKL